MNRHSEKWLAQTILLMCCAQWVWATIDLFRVLESKEFPEYRVEVVAKKAVNWVQFIPGLGAPLLIDVVGSVNVKISSGGQMTVHNVDLLSDFPIERLKCETKDSLIRVFDSKEGELYAVFIDHVWP